MNSAPPPPLTTSRRPSIKRYAWWTAGFAALFALTIAAIQYRSNLFSGRTALAADSGDRQSRPSLQLSAAEVDLGVVAPSGRKSANFSLTNNGRANIELATIKTTCPCLRVNCPGKVIAPGATMQLEMDLDMREEPGFSGGLRIEVNGRTVDGQAAFSLGVIVEVR